MMEYINDSRQKFMPHLEPRFLNHVGFVAYHYWADATWVVIDVAHLGIDQPQPHAPSTRYARETTRS